MSRLAKKRAKQAAALAQQAGKALKVIETKVPSFRGKAALLDRVRRIQWEANSLEWDLNCDGDEGGTDGR